jgi:hypothetical protein
MRNASTREGWWIIVWSFFNEIFIALRCWHQKIIKHRKAAFAVNADSLNSKTESLDYVLRESRAYGIEENVFLLAAFIWILKVLSVEKVDFYTHNTHLCFLRYPTVLTEAKVKATSGLMQSLAVLSIFQHFPILSPKTIREQPILFSSIQNAVAEAFAWKINNMMTKWG